MCKSLEEVKTFGLKKTFCNQSCTRFVNLSIFFSFDTKTHLLPIVFYASSSLVRSQVAFFIIARYSSSITSFHLLASSLLRVYCHVHGVLMHMTHAKSSSPNGAPTILEDLIVTTLGATTTLLLIIAKSWKSMKSCQDGFTCFSIIFGGGTLFGKMF